MPSVTIEIPPSIQKALPTQWGELPRRVAMALPFVIVVLGLLAGVTPLAAEDAHKAQALVAEGLGRLQKNETYGAVEDFAKAIALDPASADAHCGLADAYKATNAWDSAIVEYNRAILYYPRTAAGEPKIARAFYGMGDVYLFQALHASDLKDAAGVKAASARAVAAYAQAVALHLRDINLFLNRGVAYGNLGDYKQAVADDTEAIALCSETRATYYAASTPYYNRASAYARLGEMDKAIADQNEVIRRSPADYLAFYNRGRYYQSKGNHAAAIADETKSILLCPKLGAAYNVRASAYADQGIYAKAIADYSQAISLNYQPAHIGRGGAYVATSEYDRAIIDLTQAIATAPDDARGYQNRAAAYRKKGDTLKAAADQAKAASLGPPGK